VADLNERHVLLVVGMHRSGTSSIAGLAHAAGFDLPADNVSGRPDNPEHNESLVLSDLNELLLVSNGGAWSAPPTEESLADVEHLRRRWAKKSERHFRAAFPGSRPVVWKDPRLSLLLDYWRTLLPSTAAVYVWRSPEDVASSLAARDGLSLPLGIALWEATVRQALRSLAGQVVLVVNYEEALLQPAGALEQVIEFGDGLGWGVERRSGARPPHELLDHEHRHHDAEQGLLFDSQRELVGLLEGLGGSHGSFPVVEVGPTSPWADGILAEHTALLAAGERLKRRQPVTQLRRAKRRLTGNLSLP
jgi:hypothetical protein